MRAFAFTCEWCEGRLIRYTQDLPKGWLEVERLYQPRAKKRINLIRPKATDILFCQAEHLELYDKAVAKAEHSSHEAWRHKFDKFREDHRLAQQRVDEARIRALKGKA